MSIYKEHVDAIIHTAYEWKDAKTKRQTIDSMIALRLRIETEIEIAVENAKDDIITPVPGDI